MNIFRRRSKEEESLGDRLPPGQYQTKKWPVLHYGSVPSVDPGSWRLHLTGLVREPRSIKLDEFMAMPQTTVRADVHCVTRWSLFDSDWQGVRFSDVARLVEVLPQARYALVHAELGYTTNLPLSDLMRDDVLFVHRWNGEQLTPEHGGPVRLFVPHLYFWKSAKWVTGVELLAEDQPGFWEGYGYHMRGDPWREERYGT
ncbi:MAG TPA: sulfite oxidase-like oxidoreductase [Chloroflexota bacterium]|nr:sulfite oxidase-like oxidoreductase [Chloroflexota bacterium]